MEIQNPFFKKLTNEKEKHIIIDKIFTLIIFLNNLFLHAFPLIETFSLIFEHDLFQCQEPFVLIIFKFPQEEKYINLEMKVH